MAEDSSYEITEEKFVSLARGNKADFSAHLHQITFDVPLTDTLVRAHCSIIKLDGHGRPRLERLLEHIFSRITDFAISRKKILQAQQKDMDSGSSRNVSRLFQEAKRLCVDIANTGEGGELLLFCLSESIFDLPQIISKMSLKTSTAMHVHGADGVFASTKDGILNIYWGEAKMKKKRTSSITDAITSLRPFLVEPEGSEAKREQDVFLLSSNIDLLDDKFEDAIKNYLNPDHENSLKVQHGGLCLACFDEEALADGSQSLVLTELEKIIRAKGGGWQEYIRRKIIDEGMSEFDIEFFCLPVISAEIFREKFLEFVGG